VALGTAAMLLAAACTSYRPVPAGAAPPARALVRVRYAAPGQLRAVSPAGDTVVLNDVRELTGEMASAHGDTLGVWLRSVDRAAHPAAAHVRVVPAAGDRIELRRFDWDRAGLAAILSVALIGAYLLAVSSIAG
jgi:hypothetical protein